MNEYEIEKSYMKQKSCVIYGMNTKKRNGCCKSRAGMNYKITSQP